MAKNNGLRSKIAMAVLISIASILHVFEGMIPPLPVPGAKLGLANTATLIGLRTLGFGGAISISIIRSLIGGLFSGSLFGPSFYMSFSGAVMSSISMGVASKIKGLGDNHVFVSVVGAIAHSVAQITVASQILRHSGIWYYLPILIGLSTITGVFIGLVCDKVLALLPATITTEHNSKN